MSSDGRETWKLTIAEDRRRSRIRRVEHRPFRLPSPALTSPKLTADKIRGEGCCRQCGRSRDERPLTRHHVVPESWFLGQPLALRLVRNAHANIIPLCRPCHDEVDSKHPLVREGARRTLRERMTQQEVSFSIQVRGRRWLDVEYPL